MIPILFPESETAFTGGGLGRLADCMSCSVTEELNGIFECEFRYPCDGPMYSVIQPGTIIYCEYDSSGKQGTSDMQPFDIYAREINLDGTATYRAHHISYRLNTIMYEPGTWIDGYMAANYYLWRIVSRIDGTFAGRMNNLKYGTPSFSVTGYSYDSSSPDYDPRHIYIENKNTSMSLREIIMGGENSIAGKSGAEIKWDKLQCKFMRRRGRNTSVIIRNMSNLKEFQYEYDMSSVVDAVIPYWKDSENIYLMDVLDSEARSYPANAIAAPCPLDHVYTEGDSFSAVSLDVSNVFSSKPSADDVYDYATNYYNTNVLGNAYENLTIDIQSLYDAPEYKYIAATENLQIGDSITVVLYEHSLVKPMRVVKTIWDVLGERYTKLEFGSLRRTIYNVNILGGTQEQDPDEGTVIIDGGEVEESEVEE